jgi:PST family polysaccharide transporter
MGDMVECIASLEQIADRRYEHSRWMARECEGLPHGPTGVTIAYSAAMSLWLIPHIVWCLHGTMISPWGLLLAIGRPLLSGAVAGAVAFAMQIYMGPSMSSLLRLLAGGGVMLVTYACMLLLVLGQFRFYLDLVDGMRRPSAAGAFHAGDLTR